MAAFHQKCGNRVILKNNQKTAVRKFSEFNNGIVLSSEPLSDNSLFQVKIEKALNSWSGSIEIGVIACNPDDLELPASATELKEGCWILSGSSLLQNGRSSGDEAYSADLDKLKEGDVVGVMRTDKGELKFFVNGETHGVAAKNIPERVYAIVDLYGRCAQVSIIPSPGSEMESDCSVSDRQEEPSSQMADLINNLSLNVNIPKSDQVQIKPPCVDRLRFHARHGLLVKLSCNARTAERLKPLDEFNNGVVMTHRPLMDDELFEIRIDRLVDKWSGSIEVGVTTHNPNKLDFPATMTNMRSGTTIMSGCGILTNGKGTRREYGEFNLDELQEGDRIGLMRRSTGNLHYFINGLDQDVAAERVPETIWGVVDLYGMTVKVTIVDRDEREEQNLMTRRNAEIRDYQTVPRCSTGTDEEGNDRLTFHSKCGTHAAVINNGRTVHRPNAMDDFNNGVALTNRPLKPNEIFEIRLDKMVTKWAGSIEIGVTTHSPNDLEYPSTMTNVRSGTWMMTGNGVMHNGSTIIDEYGHNLDRLKVGDRVGASRKDSGSLHFYVNGVDQGVAAVNVPESVYGVIDLYGQAAQATLIDVLDYSPDTDNSSLSNTTLYSDLRFYHVHGRNARVFNNGLTASRTRTYGEFNHAIVITNRPLKDGEMFEVKIETLVDRWSGSIEAGVTSVRPDEFDFPSTLTDMNHGTWMLSGSSVMKDGLTLKSGYPCDLDTLPIGSRIGLMRLCDSTLHYYINGVDQGPACDGVPTGVYGVIDLYGQCAQVSIINSSEHGTNPIPNALIGSECGLNGPQIPLEITHSLNTCCGKNIILENCNTVAYRNKNYAHGLVFSAQPLQSDEYFEVSLLECCKEWSGSLHIGVSSISISDSFQPANLPPVISGISYETWYLSGSDIKRNHTTLKTNYCPSLEWLTPGHKVGVRRTSEGFLKFTLDGTELGVAATNVPKNVYAVVDLFGSATKISVTSTKHQVLSNESPPESNHSLRLQESLDAFGEVVLTPTVSRLDCTVDAGGGGETTACASSDLLRNSVSVIQGQGDESSDVDFTLSEHHGRNIRLSERRQTARRVASYNQGVVVSHKPMQKGQPFQVRIEKVNPKWACGFAVGVTSLPPTSIQCVVNALCLRENSWIVYKDCVFKNGKKIRNGYGLKDFVFTVGTTIKILVDNESRLKIFINDYDLGVAATGLPSACYAVVDLNGRCEEISVVGSSRNNECEKSDPPLAERQNSQKEKADLELQEKYPEPEIEQTASEKSHRLDSKRRHSKELTKTEQKLSSSDSYNSEIQQISSHAASCSFQTDTDNFNAQIQQLTIDLKSDLQRSHDDDDDPTTVMSNSDTYNTEVQMLSGQSGNGNGQMGDTPSNGSENLPRSQSQTFATKTSKELLTKDEKIDEDKDEDGEEEGSEMSGSSIIENVENVVEEDDANADEKNENETYLLNSLKNYLKAKRPPAVTKLNSLSSQNMRNSQSNFNKRHCDYFTLCTRFKNTLGLPEGFFSKEPGTCYCDKCYQVGAIEETYKMKGEPPTEYSIPMGWAKFPLKKHPSATEKIDTWQVAFYGTRPGAIRRILDHGELVLPSMLGMERTSLKAKEDETDSSHIVFSPSIKYAACDYFVTKFKFFDSRSRIKSEATLAFQILVQPGSYKVGPPSVDVPKEIDSRFERDATEWVTKERGATTLSALLIKIEGAKN